MKPLLDAMQKVDALKDRRSKSFNHMAMVAEGAAVFQWVCVENTPAPFLGDIIPGSEMYANKVLMEFKVNSAPLCCLLRRALCNPNSNMAVANRARTRLT